jgi:predicted RNase H-like nuclease (RuvC/YqgF family)
MGSDPNYKVIELQAENENLKDEIIKHLKMRVENLESELAYLKRIISANQPQERDVGSNAIAPPSFKVLPHIRTTSEINAMLERRSLSLKNLVVSAEDISDEV